MNLQDLSKAQLAEHLAQLQRLPEEPSVADVDQLQETVQDLQVHRIELEMQNRALQEMQQELEQTLRRYSDLYDHLPIAYITVSPEGQITEANLAAAETLQRERPRLIGAFFRSFVDAYDAGRFAAHLENCLHSDRPALLELTLRPRDGSTMTVQLSSRVAPRRRDEVPQVHIALSDVSKLKAVHRVLEEINREQEAFNYSISHDLRAPLVTINNYAAIILEEHAAGMNEEGRRMLERIQSASVRMEDTLKLLLEYSTLTHEEVILENVNTAQVVKELLIEHRVLIKEKNAEIVTADALPSVRGCRSLLNQLLANLLTNALKYTEPGVTPRVRILAEDRDKFVILKVVDEGIGIDPRYHEKIFKIFERLHGYSRYPGSGVGLAIARRAAERMNGRIWVESQSGKGSCFCVELPKAAAV